MTNRLTQEHDTQLVLSYELLCLLQWLIEHDSDKLKKMVTKAVSHGLYEQVRGLETRKSEPLNDDMQHNILDFLGFLEASLAQALHQHVEMKAKNSNLMATVEQLDTTLYNPDIMMSSLEKTTVLSDKNPDLNPQELLYKELLKRWKPEKKSALN